VVHARCCLGCRHDVGRLQEESCPTTAATTATTGSYRFHLGGSKLNSKRTIGDALLADVSIDGIGAVQPSGSQQVSPAESTTYHLTAKGTGGTQDATARISVTQTPPPQAEAPSLTDEALFAQSVKDVYFDYDKADIRGDQQSSVQTDGQFLGQHSNMNITIEGHCDERGSTEYNLALGDQRATAVKNALTTQGVNASRIKTISYGKEKPFCTESNEACWQQNRRGHLVYQK
jgi:peptidoglycan-associated lipoprotein